MFNPYEPNTLHWHLFNDLIDACDANESQSHTSGPKITLVEAMCAVQEKIEDAAAREALAELTRQAEDLGLYD
jgi:hypothetical protein